MDDLKMKTGKIEVGILAFENEFPLYWMTISNLYSSAKKSGCLAAGCGRQTFSHWANQEFFAGTYPSRYYTPNHWRRVLREGVKRGLAVEGRSKLGYRTYTLVGVDSPTPLPTRKETLFLNDAVTRPGGTCNPLAGTRFA